MRLGRDWPAWAARLRTAFRDPVPFFSSAERGSEVLRGEVSWLSRYMILTDLWGEFHRGIFILSFVKRAAPLRIRPFIHSFTHSLIIMEHPRCALRWGGFSDVRLWSHSLKLEETP